MNIETNVTAEQLSDKRELRRAGIAGRKGISPDERPLFDRRICDAILQLPAFASANVVMCYRHFGGEVSVDAVAQRAQELGKTVVYPYCVDKTTMIALHPNGPDAWESGMYGILSPVLERSRRVDPATIDLIVMTCTAFDAQGNRIGMGAGYYDRFLPQCTAAVTALTAYEAQRAERIQPEPTDVPVSCIVTQLGVAYPNPPRP